MVHLLKAGDRIAVAPQILAEFMHVVTDSRRFTRPLAIAEAMNIAEQWWTAREVTHVFLDDGATQLFLTWLRDFSLGRKRLLDTQFAACLRQNGILSILTTNPGDFAVFEIFRFVTPTNTLPSS